MKITNFSGIFLLFALFICIVELTSSLSNSENGKIEKIQSNEDKVRNSTKRVLKNLDKQIKLILELKERNAKDSITKSLNEGLEKFLKSSNYLENIHLGAEMIFKHNNLSDETLPCKYVFLPQVKDISISYKSELKEISESVFNETKMNLNSIINEITRISSLYETEKHFDECTQKSFDLSGKITNENFIQFGFCLSSKVNETCTELDQFLENIKLQIEIFNYSTINNIKNLDYSYQEPYLKSIHRFYLILSTIVQCIQLNSMISQINNSNT